LTNPVGTVVSITGKEAVVKVSDRSVCPRCAAGNGCGAGIFGTNFEAVSLTVRIEDGIRIATGDKVSLSLAPRDLARAAIFAYGAPLVGLLFAAGVAYLVVDPLSDLWALVFSVSGLLAGGVTGRILVRRDECASHLSPTIVALASAQ
jgi:sigma-E factor negative regulatory protein RseC